ncbi:MAG: right-handed parallel beta-helix repeat-containing protein [Chloroflexi bacterium]|nr:right-handed parallel beta-helix repeat-containing protein [Chloroflexota bacterium]
MTKRISLFAILFVFAIVFVSLATPTFANPAGPTDTGPLALNASYTIKTVADAFVDASSASTNYGTSAKLKVDDSPVVRSFVRFSVSGVSGTVTKAVLRFYGTSSSSNGYKVFTVADNTWVEGKINNNNAPATGTLLGSSGAVTSGAWSSVDVTAYVKGNGTFSFGLKATTGALALSSREGSKPPQLVITTGTVVATVPAPTSIIPLPTPTKVPATATPPPPSGNQRILCDGKVYDGYTSRLFQLDGGVDADASVQKVIRNCTFRNSKEVPIVLQNARNVLIEGNTFYNIRTRVVGDGVHAINITGPSSGGIVDGVIIRNNSFRDIGADGIQIGQNTRNIKNVWIQNNEFVGSADVGENGVDVKGADGPIYITGNKVHGFRPCESPKTNPPGNQDCSGSNGPGITVHDGGANKTPAYNVTLENNDIYDNTIGLVVATGARNIVVRGNRISNNQKQGIEMHDVYSVNVTGNTLSNNPTHIDVSNTPQSGGSCTISNNTFIGGGTNIKGGC